MQEVFFLNIKMKVADDLCKVTVHHTNSLPFYLLDNHGKNKFHS